MSGNAEDDGTPGHQMEHEHECLIAVCLHLRVNRSKSGRENPLVSPVKFNLQLCKKGHME